MNSKKLKDEFALPEGVIYLDGNSLGARPKKSLAVAQHIISQEWGEDLINSWNKADWWGLPTRLGDKVAKLIGAEQGEVVISDSTTLNLFKVLSAAVKFRLINSLNTKLLWQKKMLFNRYLHY